VAQLESSLLAFGRDLSIEQRVLLAEDDAGAQAEMIETLAQGEILADMAMTAEEALERLSERAYALLVTSAQLPDSDGVELIAQARQIRPNLEVIVCTSSDALDEALQALEQGASDVLSKPYPSRPFISWKVRAALGRYAFAARTQAIIRFLKDSCERIAVDQGQDLTASCIVPLKKALESYQQEPGPTKVSVLGPKPMVRVAAKLGYETTHAQDLSSLVDLVEAGEAQVVVVVEEASSLDAVEVITLITSLDPEVGLFVVAPERKLQDLVQAIGTGIGDYLLRPLEGRELFGPRLRSLIARRERSVRYNRLLTELKSLNIDLQKALARP
jgi:DNA-binding response OmpR family regulator